MIFENREEAGEKLAELLQKKYASQETIVYALPRGGVVTAYKIAKKLNIPIDIILTRKIGHPFEKEYALAVVSETGNITANKKDLLLVDKEWLRDQVVQEMGEIKRRREVYMGNKKSLSARNKIVIIVDDGIATGLTIKAAIAEIKSQNPKKIIIAVPVMSQDILKELQKEVDEVVSLDVDKNYLGAVGDYYKDFPQISDDIVISLLKR